ncbi:LAFA_0E16710g1_1 [Lachancea sp. 'fantastica']|nr:LAFA_0E16710g1_1 [Lachancea sp. 'fantastica']
MVSETPAIAEKKQEDLANSATSISGNSSPQSRETSASQLRLRKDLAALDLPPNVKIDATALESDHRLYIQVTPDEGYYKDGTFKFQAVFKDTYPIEPPKVTLIPVVYHPNIDLQGNVCLNILREDWSPVLDVQSIIIGLLMLLLEPNATDPLNKTAAEALRTNPSIFQSQVASAMRGGYLQGLRYDRIAS